MMKMMAGGRGLPGMPAGALGPRYGKPRPAVDWAEERQPQEEEQGQKVI